MPLGGKRKGAGRKKTLKSEVIAQLRDKITDDDFELALDTLRYAMSQRKKNLKAASSAAQFIVDHKIGRAPQTLEHTAPDGFDITIRSVQ